MERTIDLRGDRRRRRREAAIRRAFLASAAVSIVVSAAIVLTLIGQAVTFLLEVELGQLWEVGWFPRRGLYDLRTILAGTVLVAALAMLVATPLGLGAAVYLSEYADRRIRRALKPSLEVLAGIPSVVLGFFALTWISPNVINRLFQDAAIFNLGAAGIGVGILVTPLVASISEDALRAVPGELREASYGLGARKRTTTLRVVFPAAISGVMASLIVGLARAIGETMVVAIAAGATGGSLLTWDITQPGQTMTAAMAALAIGSDQVRGADATFQSLFFVGLLLFLMTLALTTLSNRFVRRVRQRY
ncbi:MAG: phosphate ABC transporter permease subunit PstC [Actinomycetota bacterium]|nr:phosphate ABC transporter permease subunit PstC [Actinomycetota bacterium]